VNGLGVQADIDGKRVLVGSRNFLSQHGVDTNALRLDRMKL